MLVVGSPASSTSKRLAEVAVKCGATAYLLQDSSEIEPDWLAGAQRVGVTAGASTPEELVQGVLERLRELAPGVEIEYPPEIDEGMVFPLPLLLR